MFIMKKRINEFDINGLDAVEENSEPLSNEDLDHVIGGGNAYAVFLFWLFWFCEN